MKTLETLSKIQNQLGETRVTRHARKHIVTRVNTLGYNLLSEIHDEIGDWKRNQEETEKELEEQRQADIDQGLTSEINTKISISDTSETMERIVALLNKHSFGYKGGVHRKEDPKGFKEQVKEEAADIVKKDWTPWIHTRN